MKKKFTIKKLYIVIIIIVFEILAIVFACNILAKKGTWRNNKKTSETEKEITTTVINGKEYREKNNIKTYLFIGEDETGEKKEKTEINGQGQCDTLQLLVIDKNNNSYVRIPINRNTICDVNSLDKDGKVLATTKLQISYAHANGDGMEMSCENVADSVSKLFHGITIDEYCSLDMDAIKVLNQYAGGVEITFDEDMTTADPAFKVGKTLILTDEQAEKFVRTRMSVSDGTNESRMKRQEQYLAALKENYIEKTRANDEFPADVYKALKPYMVSSISLGDISRLAKVFLDFTDNGKLTIDGQVGEDKDGFSTFTPEQSSIDEIAVKLFFEEKK